MRVELGLAGQVVCIGLALLSVALPVSGEQPARRADTQVRGDEGGQTEKVTVVGGAVTEMDSVGSNRQPEWTTRRRFGNSDVYVQPPWQIEVGTGWVVREPDDDGVTRHRLLQEIEIGLPYRFQVDLELAEDVKSGDGEFANAGVELRWALADWGVIPFNPTVYGEWEFHPDESDEFELKALFGDSVTPRLFTAVNFFYEQKVDHKDEHEFAISNAWSYSVVERALGVGFEMRLTLENEKEIRTGKPTEEEYEALFAMGPSFSWRITEQLSLVAAPLFGVTEEAPDIENFLFLRYYFGGEDDEEERGSEQTPSMEAR